MTKQKEIRERIKEKILVGTEIPITDSERKVAYRKADGILAYLHSQGVVISNGGTCAVGDLTVEPLIEVENGD